MKKNNNTILLLGYLLLSLYTTINTHAQVSVCQKVEVATDSVKRKLLTEFVKEAIQKRYFVDFDKGVVHLTIYKDDKGRDCWALYPLIDDRYKANPPKRYATITVSVDWIILVYEGNSQGLEVKTEGNIEAINQCLDKVVEDRVYIRPVHSKRLKQITLPDGKKRMIEDRVHITGGGMGIWVIFNKDGTYVKTPMA